MQGARVRRASWEPDLFLEIDHIDGTEPIAVVAPCDEHPPIVDRWEIDQADIMADDWELLGLENGDCPFYDNSKHVYLYSSGLDAYLCECGRERPHKPRGDEDAPSHDQRHESRAEP